MELGFELPSTGENGRPLRPLAADEFFEEIFRAGELAKASFRRRALSCTCSAKLSAALPTRSLTLLCPSSRESWKAPKKPSLWKSAAFFGLTVSIISSLRRFWLSVGAILSFAPSMCRSRRLFSFSRASCVELASLEGPGENVFRFGCCG